MAKKHVDGFGNTPKVSVHLSEARKRQLAKDDWFVEYGNVDTRNAVAQALQLVDDDGDSIFYDGKEVRGFKVSLENILFLANSKVNGAFKFTPYHKKPGLRVWSKWEEHKKAPQTILRMHEKAGKLGLKT